MRAENSRETNNRNTNKVQVSNEALIFRIERLESQTRGAYQDHQKSDKSLVKTMETPRIDPEETLKLGIKQQNLELEVKPLF